jgi:hypothetical protein
MVAHAREHEVVIWPPRRVTLLLHCMNVVPQMVHTSGMRGGFGR